MSSHFATPAQSINVAIEENGESVIVMLTGLTENLDAPVFKMYYRADEKQARAIAQSIIHFADGIGHENGGP